MKCPMCRLILSAYYQSDVNFRETVILNWDAKHGYHFTREGERIVFVHDDATNSLSPHELGRIINQQMDPNMIKTWLTACEDHHDQDCSPLKDILNSSHKPDGIKLLRVIDCDTKCLVPASEGCRYIALSYMWGGAKPLLLKRENISELHKPGTFNKLTNDIPKTIRDSMTLVSRMGEKYLWVDSLCILQDDKDDQADSIGKMDLVYRGAILTIVAASGIDSNAGLPGLDPGTRSLIQGVEEVIPGIRMVTVNSMYTLLSRTRYMKRGWTFQEFILSPRNLIFMEHCVYYVCSRTVWSEDTVYEKFPDQHNEAIGPSQHVARPVNNDPNPWSTFNSVLFRYSTRELSFQTDGLNAMKGILNRVCSEMNSDHIEGIPINFFDLGILHWVNTNTRERREGFPTWSWTGWIGHIRMFTPTSNGFDTSEWLQQQTYITWYIWRPQEESQLPIRISPSQYTQEQTKGSENGKKMPPTASVVNGVLKDGHTEEFIYKPIETIPKRPAYNILQFWAKSITVNLTYLPSEVATMKIEFAINIDHHEHNCGGFRFDNEDTAQKSTKCTAEMILLSKTDSLLNEGPVFHEAVRKSHKPIYWVMMITWIDDIAERVGLGYMFQECVDVSNETGVIWKEIILA